MPSEHPYESDEAQNATFARLAAAMLFVAVAMLIAGAIVGSAAVVLARSTWPAARSSPRSRSLWPSWERSCSRRPGDSGASWRRAATTSAT
jgi:heme A synthase